MENIYRMLFITLTPLKYLKAELLHSNIKAHPGMQQLMNYWGIIKSLYTCLVQISRPP